MRLVIVVFDQDNSFAGSRSAGALNATSLEVKTVIVNAQFSRSVALDRGAGVMLPQDLMFFVDVDVSVAPGALDNVRLLVERGVSVYFPIVFSQFGRDNTSSRQALFSNTLFVPFQLYCTLIPIVIGILLILCLILGGIIRSCWLLLMLLLPIIIV